MLVYSELPFRPLCVFIAGVAGVAGVLPNPASQPSPPATRSVFPAAQSLLAGLFLFSPFRVCFVS